jgi:hypothetical protein
MVVVVDCDVDGDMMMVFLYFPLLLFVSALFLKEYLPSPGMSLAC